MISYAQNREDVVLMRIFAGEAAGFYVDVGAYDPVTHSVTKAFYDIGWRGINIEPQPALCTRLDKERERDVNLNIAMSDAEGTATLLVTKYRPLSTLDPLIVDGANADYAIMERLDVRTSTLAVVLAKHATAQTIHFLKIDVEGHEAAVLRGADFRRFRPIVIVVEAVCPTTAASRWEPWETMLISAGYEFMLFDGLNRFYLCRERADLRGLLYCGANCLDDYITHREAELRERLARQAALLSQLEPA